MVNHVKAFLVRELGKNFIFKSSLFAKFPASAKYLAICSTVDSLVSPANFVNLGIFHPLGNSACNTYSDKGDTKFGLCNPVFKPFWAKIFSTKLAKLFCPATFSCRTCLRTLSASWFLLTKTTSGSCCSLSMRTGWAWTPV